MENLEINPMLELMASDFVQGYRIGRSRSILSRAEKPNEIDLEIYIAELHGYLDKKQRESNVASNLAHLVGFFVGNCSTLRATREQMKNFDYLTYNLICDRNKVENYNP